MFSRSIPVERPSTLPAKGERACGQAVMKEPVTDHCGDAEHRNDDANPIICV